MKRFHYKDQEGVALLMTLMIAAVALAVMGSLMTIMVMGTRISGLNKRFTTALEAGKGGQAVVLEYIGTRGDPDSDFTNSISWDDTGITSTCSYDKLNRATVDWDDTCNALTVIDPGDETTYDFKFDLGSYTIYSKIVNTIEGNTGPRKTSASFVTQGVVTAGGGGGAGSYDVVQVPYLYTIEMDARRGTSTNSEKARLSVLYQY